MSTPFETCPKCSAHFEGKDALLWGGVATYRGVVLPGASSKVRCPGCGFVFEARNVRFFGFLSAPALCLVLLAGALVVSLLMVMIS